MGPRTEPPRSLSIPLSGAVTIPGAATRDQPQPAGVSLPYNKTRTPPSGRDPCLSALTGASTLQTIAHTPDPLLQLLASHGQRAAILILSDERDMWQRHSQAAWQRGHRDGWRAGYAQAEADMAAAWETLTEPIAHPERGTARRIQAALAGERQDQAGHEHRFTVTAHGTPPRDRTVVQAATDALYQARA